MNLILCGLQRINSYPFDIFDEKDVRFRDFRGSMETTYQDLHKEGIGVEIKHAPIISGDEEIILWERQILGCQFTYSSCESCFFLNGKNFCLRGGKEHRDLKFSQLQRKNDHWKYCHGNFGPAKKLVRGTKIPGIMVRPDHFPLKNLVRTWNNGPSQIKSAEEVGRARGSGHETSWTLTLRT